MSDEKKCDDSNCDDLLNTIFNKLVLLDSNGQNSNIYHHINDKYIIKEIELTKYITLSDTYKEYVIQKKAHELNIAPKVYYHGIRDDKAYIIMDKIENFKSLTDLYSELNKDESLKQNIREQISIKVKELYENGIYHLDLHSDNILIVNYTSNPKIYIIDYGLCELFDSSKKENNTTPKEPYKHKFIEIINTNDFMKLSTEEKKGGKTNMTTNKTTVKRHIKYKKTPINKSIKKKI